MSCGVGRRRSSDPALLWLWRRPAATTLTWPLAWETTYAAGAAKEMEKRRKKKKENQRRTWTIYVHGRSSLDLAPQTFTWVSLLSMRNIIRRATCISWGPHWPHVGLPQILQGRSIIRLFLLRKKLRFDEVQCARETPRASGEQICL